METMQNQDLNPYYRINIIMYQLFQLAHGGFEANAATRGPRSPKEEQAVRLALRHRREWEGLVDG